MQASRWLEALNVRGDDRVILTVWPIGLANSCPTCADVPEASWYISKELPPRTVSREILVIRGCMAGVMAKCMCLNTQDCVDLPAETFRASRETNFQLNQFESRSDAPLFRQPAGLAYGLAPHPCWMVGLICRRGDVYADSRTT